MIDMANIRMQLRGRTRYGIKFVRKEYISVSTVGTIFTDWANDGVFGDGWHLFGIGAGAYEEACSEYAEENFDAMTATVLRDRKSVV